MKRRRIFYERFVSLILCLALRFSYVNIKIVIKEKQVHNATRQARKNILVNIFSECRRRWRLNVHKVLFFGVPLNKIIDNYNNN